MKPMIERIARTLCKLDGHAENISFEGKPMWQSYIDVAVAVLEGMRDPTPAMEAAWVASGRQGATAPLDWDAMLDAAIAERP